jgi:hypothetical protein
MRNLNPKNKFNTSSKIDKIQRREKLNCPICPPNRGENSKRKAKRGVKKPRYKDKR